MKVWKKLSAVALALVMVLALSVTAFAEGDGDAPGGNTSGATETKSDNDANASGGINAVANAENTIKIAKEIIFINGEATNVREPNIEYTYTISAVEASALTHTENETTTTATVTGPLVSDANTNMTATVKAGVIGAVVGTTDSTTSKVTFVDTTKTSATSTGASDRKYASFTFTPATFTEAGIYRYKITESVTSSNNKAAVGITAVPISESAAYNADRYLDVYVKWNDEHTSREIYGYVLFEGNVYDSLTATSTKSAGYVNTDTSAQADVDVYTTQNLLITGTTTGTLGDKNHDFPVSITLAKATGLVDSIKLDFTVTGNGVLNKANNNDDYVALGALTGSVRDGSTILITGIPAGSTVTMTEQNTTPDSYKVKVGTTANGADALTENTVSASATSSATTSQTLSAKVSLFITNTLDAISPTGVTLRFAPYIAMLGAGVVALPLTLRKKEEEI